MSAIFDATGQKEAHYYGEGISKKDTVSVHTYIDSMQAFIAT